MKTFKARGIVVREYEAGESDKRLVLLCKELGRVLAYAKGARKAKSKFLAASQLFTYGDFVLNGGTGFNSVAQAEVIESFYKLRSDYERLLHAQRFAEICERTVLENTQCDELLLLLLKSLSHLCGSAYSPTHVSCVFMFRFFKYYGLSPSTDSCCKCGGDENLGFLCGEGAVCGECARGAAFAVSQGALCAMRHILGAELKEAFMFEASDGVLAELTKAGKLLWDCHFDVRLKTDKLLETQVIHRVVAEAD